MSTRETTVVHVASEAEFDAFVEHLRGLRHEHILITLDETSDVLLTGVEYRRAASIARLGEVSLTIATSDPLRQQLASMLGWRVESPPDAASDREPVVDHSTTADLATYRPEHLPPVAE
ncbi:MAG TPA: hypothetical protein VFI42_06130, partial [Thermomicrobiaceae bacterium]|nr:hypothetical protein [Thermomicrobiaceae bacterium]